MDAASEVAEGWTVCESRLVPDDLEELAAVLRDVAGPAVIAFVMFSDDCWLVGALDGTVAWEWSFGDEYERGGELAAVANDPSVDLDAVLASRMRAVIPRIVGWAAAAGLEVARLDRLEAVLERGYICAEDGLFALLDELGVTAPLARRHRRLGAAAGPGPPGAAARGRGRPGGPRRPRHPPRRRSRDQGGRARPVRRRRRPPARPSPARVLLTLWHALPHGQVAPNLTMAAVTLAKQAASRFGAVTGLVTAGRGSALPDCSPYEKLVGDNPFRRPRLDRVSRGAHWGTFLTARHLEQLGGIQALRDLGLFHSVERLAGPPGELVWLQLTPIPTRSTSPRCRRWPASSRR